MDKQVAKHFNEKRKYARKITLCVFIFEISVEDYSIRERVKIFTLSNGIERPTKVSSVFVKKDIQVKVRSVILTFYVSTWLMVGNVFKAYQKLA